VSGTITIALDAMGGDRAPEIVLRGADIALERYPGTHFLLFGAEEQISPLLAQLPRSPRSRRCTIRARCSADDKPSQALRAGRGTSMRLAIDAVAEGAPTASSRPATPAR
jgi:glycerol-3-phosphate acyltransferase PlsX